jgi:deoxycytidine triphosphate deaminase
MSILSNQQIRKGHKSGHIVIDPFVSDNIRKSSVDVRLGHWFWKCDTTAGVYNPRDKNLRDRYFAGPYLMKSYEAVFNKISPNVRLGIDPSTADFADRIGLTGLKETMWPEPGPNAFIGIPEDFPVLVMEPGETVLAHTIEFIGIYPPGTTEMRARSTWGRNGLGVCKCAGAGDPGYVYRWTYELTNFNRVPLIIPCGERIAQVIFHKTGQVLEGVYGAETGNYRSHYQDGSSVDELKAKWSPYDMLPKPSTDPLILPEDYLDDLESIQLDKEAAGEM